MSATTQNVPAVAAMLITRALAQVRDCVNERETDGVKMIDALSSIEEVAKTLDAHSKADPRAEYMSPAAERRLRLILENEEAHSPGDEYTEIARQLHALRIERRSFFGPPQPPRDVRTLPLQITWSDPEMPGGEVHFYNARGKCVLRIVNLTAQ